MKDKTIRFIQVILLLIMIGVFYIWVSYSGTAGHEIIHRKIFRRYAINTTMNVGLFTGSVTVNNASEYYKCGDACKTQHTLNDVIHYEMIDLINTFFGLFFIYILYKGWVDR